MARHSLVLTGREHFEWNPRVRNVHRDQDRGAVPEQQSLLPGPARVVLRRHEDRAAFGVLQHVVVRLGVDGEAVVGGPIQDGLAAATQDRDVERLDLDLLQHLGRAGGLGATGREVQR
jgi:hypothetical protein